MSEPERDPTLDAQIIIVGAGFSGLGLAIQLKEKGIEDFLILERSQEVGGTWRDNQYPGAACDVPAHLYSFSFDMNPEWNYLYARQPEIQSYILKLTAKYNIRPFIRFGKNANQMRFDSSTGVWRILTEDGSTYCSKFLIGAMGPLANPKMPQIDGLNDFTGKVIHSARWDRGYDFAQKKVALIGTGASAVQIVPELAEEVKKLTVFQRTAPWVVPRPDQKVSAGTKNRLRSWKWLLWFWRVRIYLINEVLGPFIFKNGWGYKVILEFIANRYRIYSVKDPDLRKKTRPNYRIGCKRILVSNDWYRTLSKDHVSLETDSIESITPDGVRFGGKSCDVDTIVLATGFDAPTEGVPFDIVGLNHQTLDDSWKNGASAYKGVATTGFPNLFFLVGPNTGPGHTSVLVYLEAQIRYLIQMIEGYRARPFSSIEVKEEVQKNYNRWIEKRMGTMVWTNGGCQSWYLTEAGKNTSLYPGLSADYLLRMRKFKASDYHICYR